MTRALIVTCDEQQAEFSNGDMLQFSDDSINLTDYVTVNGMVGYCISIDWYNNYTGNCEYMYEFFQTLTGWIYPILYCNYEYDETSHNYYVNECELDGKEPIAYFDKLDYKSANVRFWRTMYKAIQAMQE